MMTREYQISKKQTNNQNVINNNNNNINYVYILRLKFYSCLFFV